MVNWVPEIILTVSFSFYSYNKLWYEGMAKRCPCFWQHQQIAVISLALYGKKGGKRFHIRSKKSLAVYATPSSEHKPPRCMERLYTILLFLWFIHSDTFYVLGVLNFSVNHKNSDCIILLKKCRTASHRTYGFTRNKWRGTTHVLLLDDKTKKYDSMRHHFQRGEKLTLDLHEK